MRVALDATPLSAPGGGIRRYTVELACALAAKYPGDEYYLLSDQPFEMPDRAPPNLLPGPAPASRLDRRWWTIGLARTMRRLGADVFHGTDFAVPYLPLRPAVMTIHDLSPWRVGTAGFASARIRRRTPWLLRCGLARRVITPTEAIRRETISRFRLPPDRVVAVPLAASEWFRPVAPAHRERPYFLCIGSSNPRKNIAVVKQAWAELRNEIDVDLVVVGEPGTEPVPDRDLPALYSGAIAFLYPSLYEGFGLPVLEAMRCGAMVIASRDAAVMEVAGGAAVLVDAADGRGWVTAMRAALSGEARAAWRGKSLARAAGFTWERTATMTREVYEQALPPS